MQNGPENFTHLLSNYRTNFTREKRSLECTIDEYKDELRLTKNQLEYESKWKDTAENIHRQILEEKSEMTTKYVVQH